MNVVETYRTPVASLPPHLNPNTEPTYAFCYPLSTGGEAQFELRHFFNKKKHACSLLFPLRLYDFEGVRLWGPANGREICRLNYGEDCFTTTMVKHFRKHCISGITATWGHRLCTALGI